MSRYPVHVFAPRPVIVIVAVMVATALVLQPASVTSGQADDLADADDLRREVKLLRAQVQSLRAAMSEMAELDRQRSAALTRALKGMNGGDAIVSAPQNPARRGTGARAEPGEALPPPAVRRAPEPPPPPPAVSVVRGKVDLPPGEPVAYVYVENILEPAVKGQKVVIKQEGKTFIPSWAVVQRGTTIEFPNLDNIYHNVFSLSSGNSFDLGLYNSANDQKGHTFTEPGAVDIYCNIHPQMAASALVLPNRHYAKVKRDGTFEIPRVPDGKRKVVAWAPGSRLTVQWVELKGGGAANVSFKLESKGAGHQNKAGRSYGSYE